MRIKRFKSIGYGAYGQNPFQPDFTICKSEGGTANCPSEYVKEFSGFGAVGSPENPVPQEEYQLVEKHTFSDGSGTQVIYKMIFANAQVSLCFAADKDLPPEVISKKDLNVSEFAALAAKASVKGECPAANPETAEAHQSEAASLGKSPVWPYAIGGVVLLAIGVWVFISLRSFDAATTR